MSLTFTKVNPARPSSVSLSLSFSIPSPTPPPGKRSPLLPRGLVSQTPSAFLCFSFHLSQSSAHHLTGQARLSSDRISKHRSVLLPDPAIRGPTRNACQAQWHTSAPGSAQISLSLSPSYPHSSSVSLVPSFPVTLSHSCQPTLSRCQSESARTNNTLPLTLTNGANLPRLHRHDHGHTDTRVHLRLWQNSTRILFSCHHKHTDSPNTTGPNC